MNIAKYFPRRGRIYSLRTIETELQLRDSAFLRLFIDRKMCVIQTSHITTEELLSIPEIAESQWEYQYETNEWIPLFLAEDMKAILSLVDYEPELDYENQPTEELWVTWKAFPREQFNWEEENV